jgi:hypothetical protein
LSFLVEKDAVFELPLPAALVGDQRVVYTQPAARQHSQYAIGGCILVSTAIRQLSKIGTKVKEKDAACTTGRQKAV